MHTTVVYFFLGNFTFVNNFFSKHQSYDKSLWLHLCYFQDGDKQAGFQVKLFIGGTLKENKNASRNFSSKAQYQISHSSFESLRVGME
jgi:hypothetical protein